MGIERSSPQFVKNLNGPTQPSGPGFGYLLVSIMAVFLIVSNMYGFEQASGLPYMIGLSVAILAFAMRMYLLRRRAPYERATSGGLDRVLFYLPPAILSTGLSAFAIYSFFAVGAQETPRRRPAREMLENAVVVIEDYYRAVRTKIRARLETNAKRLRELDYEPPSQRRQAEIFGLLEEQQMLRRLFSQAAVELRPSDPEAPAPYDSTDNSSDGARLIRKDSVQDWLSRKFDAAARLHQQLPDFIRRDVEAPMLESLPEDAMSGDRLERFFRDVMALTNEALGCLAVPMILEFFIVILVLSNRPRD